MMMMKMNNDDDENESEANDRYNWCSRPRICRVVLTMVVPIICSRFCDGNEIASAKAMAPRSPLFHSITWCGKETF